MDLFYQGANILGEYILSFIPNYDLKRRNINAGLLCQMPYQEGNEGSQKHKHEERQADNPRDMPHMRNIPVPHWYDLTISLQPR